MSDLPHGWEWATIGQLLDPMNDGKTIHQGWSPKCNSYPSLDDNVWAVLKTTAVQPGSFHPEHNKELPPSLSPRPGIEVTQGDLLVTCAGPRARCGVACLIKRTRPRLMMSGKMYRFRTNDEYVSARYLEAYLQTSQAWLDIDSMKTGGSDSGLNLTQVGFQKLRLPVAPRAEQERIVAAIEGLFSRLDAAEASIRLARQRLVAFEQRLLDEALEGEPVLLGDLLAKPLRNGLSAPASSSGSIRVVTLTAVTKSEFVDAHSKLIEPGDRSVDGLWMKPGDIFIQRSNTPELVGTAALYNGGERWAIFPDLLIRVRVDGTRVYPSYVELVLRSTALRRYFQRAAQGVAGSMPKISQPTVEAAEIPVPPIERQEAIVGRLSDGLIVARRMAAEVERFTAKTRSLRRAILAAAFSGRLVAQDPGDDAASVLLERLRAQRAPVSTTVRTRRATAS